MSPVLLEEMEEFTGPPAFREFPTLFTGSAVKVSNSGETYFSRPYKCVGIAIAEDLDLDLGRENDLVLECCRELLENSDCGVSFFNNTLLFFLVQAPLYSSGMDCLEELEFLLFVRRPFTFVLHFFSEFLMVLLFEEGEVKYDVVLAFLKVGTAPYLVSFGSWV